ncbi:MAG: hypothetical protein CSA15_02315 [Candidatus Delongbacteria bacterium]|nr:MAG: hypothetical protein CSA15_02315 [Candidatus Delongbacteria bacterium]
MSVSISLPKEYESRKLRVYKAEDPVYRSIIERNYKLELAIDNEIHCFDQLLNDFDDIDLSD